MIAFNFEYYRPESINEAVSLYEELDRRGKKPLYYSGGTEIITMARRNDIFTEAVIDIKGIPDCNAYIIRDNQFVTGAAVSLTHVSENVVIPVLSRTAGFAADHTARTKITTGGNICGKIIYREAVLGYLIADSNAIIYGKKGKREVPINMAFNQKLQLEDGDLLVQLATDIGYSGLPCVCIRKNKQGETGYPLISMAALKKDNYIRMAFSGVCSFPFRSGRMEEAVNNRGIPMMQRIELAINNVPAPIFGNIQGSSEYKRFVLGNLLEKIIEALDGEKR